MTGDPTAPSALVSLDGTAEPSRRKGPRGVGMWIAWNGGATKDVDNAGIIAQAQRAGIGWLCVKFGDDGRSTRWFARSADLIARAKDAGIGFYAWNYSRPETWAVQADEIGRVIAQGAEGAVVDAETEWEWAPGSANFSSVDRRPAASAFMSRVRSLIGDTFLAHAPIWRPQSHPLFPWEEFGSRCDAVLPQFYWCAAGQHAADFCARGDAAWAELLAKYPEHTREIWPAGLTYGAGDGWDLWTSQPGAVPLTGADVNVFLDRYASGAPSLFSWDAANARAWAALNARADAMRDRAPDTLPAPPDSAPTT